MTEVAGGGLVAVAQIISFAPAIWTSTYGVAWDSTILNLLGAEGTLEEVVAIGQRVVALGRSSVAISEDGGGTWTQIAYEGLGPRGGAVQDAILRDDRSLLAVMSTDSGATAYTSDDGLTWEQAGTLPPSPEGGTDRVAEVLALDDGTLLAAGLAFNPAGTSTVATTWASTDGGRSWVREDGAIPPSGTSQLTALAATSAQTP